VSISIGEWHAWEFEGSETWTNWRSLSEVSVAAAPAAAGAYVLGIPATRGSNRARIGRLLADDLNGVLDIGESGHLRKRLQDLHRCISTPGQVGHMAGWRLGSFGLLEKLRVSVSDLRVSWRSTQSKEDAYRVEGEMLRWYFDIFGELPPLNYKFNWTTWVDS